MVTRRWRALVSLSLARSPLRAVCGVPLRSRATTTGGGGRVSHRRRDRKPAPLSVERRPRRARRRPCELPSPRCVARRAGAPSAMHQPGELLVQTLALNPTKAGSAISRIVLSFRAKGAIVPAGCAAPAAALPLARTSRCARKRGFGWGCAYQASSTSTSRLCLLVGAAGGARPRGAARRRFLSGVGGRACDAAPRGPWSPGDRRMRVHSASRAPRTRTASAAANCCFPSVLHAASSSALRKSGGSAVVPRL